MKQFTTHLIRIYLIIILLATFFASMISSIALLDLGLKTYVFKAADAPSYIEICSPESVRYAISEERTLEDEIEACERRNERAEENYQQQKAENAVRSLSVLLISLPLFSLHYVFLKKERKSDK